VGADLLSTLAYKSKKRKCIGRFFIRWHGRSGDMRHLRDMGAKQVKAFLTMLATEPAGV
jgi:hypothetical protein